MDTHEATCACGQLRATAEGEPVRVSVCHCLACQKRTGSAFGIQARFADERVHTTGEFHEWTRVSDDGESRTYRFCPVCGSTVTYVGTDSPGLTAIAVGAFADPEFPSPRRTVYEHRRHPWLTIEIE